MRPSGYTKAKVKADRKNAVPSSPWKIFQGLREPLKGCPVFTQRPNSQREPRAVILRAGAVIRVSENVLTGSGLTCPHHRARVQQNTWSGYPGSRKGDCAPIFFFFFFLLFSFHCSADGGVANARPQEPQLAGWPCARFCT